MEYPLFLMHCLSPSGIYCSLIRLLMNESVIGPIPHVNMHLYICLYTYTYIYIYIDIIDCVFIQIYIKYVYI